MVAILLIVAGVLLFSGTSIFVSLGLAGFLAIVFGSDIQPMIVAQRMIGGVNSFALMALPFFILAANLMDTGGLSRRILAWARALVGHVTGGLAMATQVASMFFGALSGSSPATVVAVGKIMYPELVNMNYPKSFIGGLLASSGSVALIIPPSITMIIFGAVTGVSVGKLFIAGITAGIIYGGSSLVYIYLYARKHELAPDKKVSWSDLLKTTIDAAWALLIPVIILGGIYGGFFTPTEAAGVSALYALIIGLFVYKELTFKKIYEVFVDSAISSAQVLVLVAAAQVLGWVLTVGQVTQKVANGVLGNITSPVLFLLALNFILLIMGMFMDGSASIIILAPLVMPLAAKLGIDPVHMGIIMISNLALGLYTPPFGMNIFVTSSITGQSMVEMMPGLIRFILVNIIGLMIITYCPKLILFLPNLF